MKKVLSLTLSLVMLLTLISCGGSGDASNNDNTAEGTLKKYFEATASGDADTVFDILNDPYFIRHQLDPDLYADEQAYRDIMIPSYAAVYPKAVKYHGDNLRLTKFEVEYAQEYNQPYELSKISAYLANYGYPEDVIEDVCVIAYNATMTGDKRSSSDRSDMVMIKLGGKWYASTILWREKVEQLLFSE